MTDDMRAKRRAILRKRLLQGPLTQLLDALEMQDVARARCAALHLAEAMGEYHERLDEMEAGAQRKDIRVTA